MGRTFCERAVVPSQTLVRRQLTPMEQLRAFARECEARGEQTNAARLLRLICDNGLELGKRVRVGDWRRAMRRVVCVVPFGYRPTGTLVVSRPMMSGTVVQPSTLATAVRLLNEQLFARGISVRVSASCETGNPRHLRNRARDTAEFTVVLERCER